MNGPRVKVILRPSGVQARGTLLDNRGEHGPSRILVDATYPYRLVEPADWRFVFQCVFDRIGPTRDVAPLTVEARTGDQLAEQVYRYARRFLGSSEPTVTVDMAGMRGQIVCGLRDDGAFTISAVEPETEVPRA